MQQSQGTVYAPEHQGPTANQTVSTDVFHSFPFPSPSSAPQQVIAEEHSLISHSNLCLRDPTLRQTPTNVVSVSFPERGEECQHQPHKPSCSLMAQSPTGDGFVWLPIPAVYQAEALVRLLNLVALTETFQAEID